MASAGKVDLRVAVKPAVGIGASTIAGGSVTLVAYALALVAFIQGARDEATVSALIVGTVSLVTVLGGRYAQAIVALIPLARRGAVPTTELAAVPVLGGSNTAVTGPGLTGTTWIGPRPGATVTRVDDDDDGLGDELHPIFEGETPADPKLIPDDEGEAESPPPFVQPKTLMAVAVPKGAVSGLNAAERAKAREMVIQAVYLGLKHAKAIHYTQDVRRWEGIAKKLRAWRGQFPKYADCSAFATWVLWQGLGHFHAPDIVNGAGWLAGWTGTQLDHGKRVVHERNIKHGDLALYNGHVAICVGGGMVISHGSEGGPYLLPLHYRSDLIEVRRYI